MQWRARRARTAAVDRLRRGDRTVTMTPPVGLRFGNWLYLWMHAHAASAAGLPSLVLEAPGMRDWFDTFPGLDALTIERDQLRFHDRRVWNEGSRSQRFGEEFTREDLRHFISEIIAEHIPRDHSDTIVVNVRRGDYYAQPHLRERYGFDQVGYLKEALALAGPVRTIRLVSDDPQWCQENLAELFSTYSKETIYEPQGAIPNFLRVCGGRRLIGTNSTFSYWGGYVADALHPDAQVIMPRFHARMDSSTDAHQLDPRWIIIDGHHGAQGAR